VPGVTVAATDTEAATPNREDRMFLRRSVRVLVALLLAGTAVGVTSPAAHADNTVPPPTVWVEIFAPYFNVNAAKCLDNPSGSTSVGTQMQVYHCHGYDSHGDPQRWQLFNRGTADNPYYEVRNVASNLCLFARTDLRVVQQPCNAEFGGLWRVEPNTKEGPNFSLSSLAFFGGCLATGDSSGNDHTRLYIDNCKIDDRSDTTWIRQVWSFA
jgi:hypothetical protein